MEFFTTFNLRPDPAGPTYKVTVDNVARVHDVQPVPEVEKDKVRVYALAGEVAARRRSEIALVALFTVSPAVRPTYDANLLRLVAESDLASNEARAIAQAQWAGR